MEFKGMGKRLAIAIAVEDYSDSRIHNVRFAEADARAFVDALEISAPLDSVLLLSAKATKTSITSKVRQHVGSLADEDQLFLFYAGHGFSKNGKNYITCHDTDLNDLTHTSISLQSILNVCETSKCKKIALFLDACESGITDLPEVRGIYTDLSESELATFFEAAEYRACFASCKTSESSYSSDKLKHGVWTHQILEALHGNDPLALEKGRFVTAASLQNYVAKELPRTIRKVFSKPLVQTPWFHGSDTGDFLIADLGQVIKARNAVKPGFEQVKQILFQMQQSVDIDDLSGFSKKRGHFVPENVSGATQSVVEDVSKDEVETHFDAVYDRIRASKKYKRRDITAEDGRIVTPDFEYAVYCEQDSKQPGSAIIKQQLINVSPAIVSDDNFNEVFEDIFDELTFEFSRPVSVKDLIDRIEDLDSDKLSIDYPSDASRCEIEIEDSDFTIEVTRKSLTLQTPETRSPKLLLGMFFEAQKQLSETPLTKFISPPEK